MPRENYSNICMVYTFLFGKRFVVEVYDSYDYLIYDSFEDSIATFLECANGYFGTFLFCSIYEGDELVDVIYAKHE